MVAIFHSLYCLRVRRQLEGNVDRSRMVARHYHRFAQMYGAEHNFGISR